MLLDLSPPDGSSTSSGRKLKSNYLPANQTRCFSRRGPIREQYEPPPPGHGFVTLTDERTRRVGCPATDFSGAVMARNGSGSLLSRRDAKLELFLKRHTERTVFERIRASEPCVVISDTINKAYMHVVLSDERVYLTEHAPRTLTAALTFRRVRDIELVSSGEISIHR